MDKMKVLLTGGAGYIGVVTLSKLLKKGCQVRILDNFLFGKEVLKPYKDKIEIIDKDISDINNNDLKGIDAVIHLAGLSNDPMAEFDPKANDKINTKGTIKLADLCKKNKIKRFIFSSSASIYDKGLNKKVFIQNENSAVRPNKPYSMSKYEAEKYLLKIADENFKPTIFRQGTVYGFSPRMRYDLVVNSMIKSAETESKIHVFCGGIQWRALVSVDDVADAYLRVLALPEKKLKAQILNLVYKNYKIKDLSRVVKKTYEKKTGKKISVIIDHSLRKDRSYKISGNKIKKYLHWSPKISVERSIKDMIDSINKFNCNDYSNLKYDNIKWMKLIKNDVK